MLRPSLGLSLLGALLLASCSDAGAGRPTRVVLVTLDTLRYDSLAGVDGGASEMPLLAARARDGVRFTRFYASSSVTQPSHASLFTSLHPWQHGVTRNGCVLDARFETLAEVLRTNGYETRAVAGSFPMASRFGFDQGFDAYDEEFTTPFRGLRNWEGESIPERAFFSLAETITDRAVAAIDRASSARQFFWFHYFDPHAPYGDAVGKNLMKKTVFRNVQQGQPVADALRELRESYRADVAYLDRQLERLLARLDADAEEFETHVFLVADHGEALGEGGSIGHGARVLDEVIHVPAVLLSPGAAPGVRDDVAGLVDVAPTLLALAGVDRSLGGRDLRALDPAATACGMRRTLRERPTMEPRLDGEHELPDLVFFRVDARGRVWRGHGRELTAPAGPGGESVLEEFRAYEAQLAGHPSEGELDPEVEEALRALGYVR